MRQPLIFLLCVILLMGCAEPEPVESVSSASPIVPETKTMDSLSTSQEQQLLATVAAQQNLAVDTLRVVTVTEADWPDACLGLAGADELCAQVIVPGWQVTVSDDQQSWVYRTDLEMELVKLEPSS